MNTETVLIKIKADTRKTLKILAAHMGITMMELIDLLAKEALKKQSNANPESL